MVADPSFTPDPSKLVPERTPSRSEASARIAPTILFSRNGASALFYPSSRFDDRSFDAFLRAIHGIARYDRARRVNLAPIDRVPEILINLREAGLPAEYGGESDGLHQVLPSRTAEQVFDLRSLEERIAHIDREIRERTGDSLFQHQKSGAMWLAPRRVALLADDPGTGKTILIIVSLPVGAPVLVVGPATAKGVWVSHVERYRPSIEVRMLSGRDSFMWPRPGQMLVTNYDVLPELDPRLGEPHPGTVVVADEAQDAKNPDTAKHQRLKAIMHAAHARGGRCWPLTGTPVENSLLDLWAILSLAPGLAEEAFGSQKEFLRISGVKTNGGGRAVVDLDPTSEIAERIRPVMLRRRQEDCTDLPDLLWREVVVDVDADDLRECDAFLREQGGLEKVERLIGDGKIRFDTMSRVLTILAMAKYRSVLTDVKELERRDEPVLVFSMHREPVDRLAERRGWLRISGDESAKKRKEIEEAFQDPNGGVRGIACMIRAAGLSLTLTRAAHVLFVDRAWNPARNLQAAKRAHRIGQDRRVVATFYRARHPLDERLQELLTNKSRLFVSTVDAAAVADEREVDLAEEVRRRVTDAREEIALGRAMRRLAETADDVRIVESLHSLDFVCASDDRLARDLGQEALAVGLSEKQWALATELVTRGALPRDAVSVDADAALPDASFDRVAELIDAPPKPSPKLRELLQKDGQMKKKSVVDELFSRVEELSSEERRLFVDMTEVEYDVPLAEQPISSPGRLEGIAAQIRDLSEIDRAALFVLVRKPDECLDLDKVRDLAVDALALGKDDLATLQERVDDAFAEEFCEDDDDDDDEQDDEEQDDEEQDDE